MAKTLQGKVALVTGGGRGIGAAIVRRLVEDGAKVAFTYSKSAETAKSLENELRVGGADVIAVEADSSDADKVTHAIEHVRTHFGRLDIQSTTLGCHRRGCRRSSA